MSGPQPTSDPSPGAKRRRLGWIRPVALALAGLLAAGISAASVQAVRLLQAIDEGRVTTSVPALDRPGDGSGYFSGDARNVLVLGSDSREGLTEEEQAQAGSPDEVEGERSDTIILMHLDPARERAVMVHFPRDLRVEIPGHGTDKINAAYTLGGPDLTVRTVKLFTGLPIHSYIEVNFVGFRNLVDLLRGVLICVDRPMFDPLAGLSIPEAGCHWLDGEAALAFVRARNVEGDLIPDFSRISRQQQFMRAFFNKLLSVRTLLDPALIREAARQVTTDEGLETIDLILLGQELRALAEEDPTGASSLDFRVVPGEAGRSFVEPLPEADELFEALASGGPLGDLGVAPEGLDESPAVIRVRVLKARAPDHAQEAHALLRRAGFIVLPREEAPEDLEESEILFSAGNRNRAQVVQGFFPALSLRRVPEAELDGADVAVVAADDLEVVGE